MNAIELPADIRQLLEAPNYVHLSTTRPDGSPRNSVVWVWLEGNKVTVATNENTPKAKDMRRDPRVAMSLVDIENPYRMAALRGEVVEIRANEGLGLMDRMAQKYTSAPFPGRNAELTYFVIAITSAYSRNLGGFTHAPGSVSG